MTTIDTGASPEEAFVEDTSTWEVGEGEELVPGCFAWDLLGVGRRFETWIAFCTDRLVPVCVKVPRQDRLDIRTIDALTREHRIVSDLDHPSVPRLFAIDLQADRPYLVYEFIEGKPLSYMLEDDGPFDANATILLGLQLGAVLRHVHRRGYVHLDLKPANITIRNGRPILLDFDIALPTGDRRSQTTPRGTVHYMGPEQIRCEPAHPSMDLFALGAVLFEAFTGARAFEFDSCSRSTTDSLPTTFPQLTQATPDVARFVPDVEPALVAVINRLLAADPIDRPVDADATIAELEAALPDGAEPLWPSWVTKVAGVADRPSH